MIKQKPEWVKGKRLWEGFIDKNNPSKLDDAYFKLFGEDYAEDAIEEYSDLNSYYALLPKGRVTGFEKVDGHYKYFYSLDSTNKSNEST